MRIGILSPTQDLNAVLAGHEPAHRYVKKHEVKRLLRRYCNPIYQDGKLVPHLIRATSRAVESDGERFRQTNIVGRQVDMSTIKSQRALMLSYPPPMYESDARKRRREIWMKATQF